MLEMFFSVASVRRCRAVSLNLTRPPSLQPPAALSACLLSLLFLFPHTQIASTDSNTELRARHGLLDRFFSFSLHCVSLSC